MNDLIGQTIHGYKVETFIGKGGCGSVYRAKHPLLDWNVALKVILPEYMQDPDYAHRIDEEARIMSKLEYPHIVSIYDYWRNTSDSAYLIMRFMNGGTLQDRIKSRPLTVEETGRLLNELAEALGVLEDKSIIHRDLKPANILFDDRGSTYLSDFGLAKDLTVRPDTAPLGTLAYVAPEQLMGGKLTHQVDIYSLGVILFECLTGENPFAQDASWQKRFDKDYLFPSASAKIPGIPETVDDILRKATVWNPEDRYRTAAQLADAFRQIPGSIQLAKSTSVPQPPSDPPNVEPVKSVSPQTPPNQKIFICHSTIDDPIVDRLREWLHSFGLLTWVDHLDIPGGAHWRKSIEAALESCLSGILVLSSHSASSLECEAEWERLLKLRKKLYIVRTEDIRPPYRLDLIEYIDLFPNLDDGAKKLIELLNKATFSTSAKLETPPAPDSAHYSSAILAKTANNLIARVPGFVGHRALMTEVQARLNEKKQVLLCGFRGSGKTVLAAEIAAQYVLYGQVLWLDVHKRSNQEIFAALAKPLRMMPLKVSDAGIESQWITSLRQSLLDQNIRLIVLDNVLSDETSLDQVLKAIPSEISVLVTSYIRYSVDIVREVKLEESDALALFVHYANGGSRDYTTDDVKVKDLCQKLANHAFALELAARRIKRDGLTTDELLRKVSAALEQMTHDYLPPYIGIGTQSVAALIENTIEELPQKTVQALFLAFGGLFASHATPRLLALYLHKDVKHENKVEKGLLELQQRGLVTRVAETDTSAAYFYLHDLAHLYVREKFLRSRKSRVAPLEACQAFAKDDEADLNFIEAELDNLLGAAQKAYEARQYDAFVAIMKAFRDKGYMDDRGYSQALLEQLDRAIEITRKNKEIVELHYFLSKRGSAYYNQGNLPKALSYFRRATYLARLAKLPQREMIGLAAISTTYAVLGDFVKAETRLRQAEEIVKRLNLEELRNRILEKKGFLEQMRHNDELAQSFYARAVESSNQLNNPNLRWFAYLNLAATEEDLGKGDTKYYEESINHLNIALQIARDEKNPIWTAHSLFVQGLSYQGLRNYEKAVECFRLARDIYRERGYNGRGNQSEENLREITKILTDTPH